jgi:hypothetical protein
MTAVIGDVFSYTWPRELPAVTRVVNVILRITGNPKIADVADLFNIEILSFEEKYCTWF